MTKHHLIFLFWLGLVVAACQPGNLVTPPTSQPAEELEPGETAPARLDKLTEETISILQNQLQANEADTFAGLWLAHEPIDRIIVAFTENGEETMQQYVMAGSELAQRIEVRDAEYTLAQLEADQEAVSHILETIQQSAGIGIMVMENRVVVDIAGKAALETALAEANATLPDSVIINAIYEPVGENLPFEIAPPPDVFMPQLKQRDAAFMEALLIGELVVEDGCLRVNNDNESTLVIWQADYYLTENDGLLEILDESGVVVAQVGETISLGGGEQPTLNEAELRQPVPEQCGSPYWRMGQFLPEAYKPDAASDAADLYPIVDGRTQFLLGAVQNGHWLTAVQVIPQLGEREYTLHKISGIEGSVTGVPSTAPGGVCSQPTVTLQPAGDYTGAIALDVAWEVSPRAGQMLTTVTAVYQQAVAELLQQQGLANPDVQLKQVLRVDLEGDGVDEVLVGASRLVADTNLPPTAAGDYSLVILRKIVGGSVMTIPLQLDVYPEANDLTYPYRYEITAVLDLNGDGVMEIIVHGQRYEGEWVGVFESTQDEVELVLSASCGL